MAWTAALSALASLAPKAVDLIKNAYGNDDDDEDEKRQQHQFIAPQPYQAPPPPQMQMPVRGNPRLDALKRMRGF